MAYEESIGYACRIAIHNPTDHTQVLRVTVASPQTWDNMDVSTANNLLTPTRIGTSGLYGWNWPAAASRTTTYKLSIFAASATSANDTILAEGSGSADGGRTINGLSAEAQEDVAEVIPEPSSGQSVTITPIRASAANPRLSSRKLATIPQGTGPTDLVNLTDSAGDPVDLSGRTLRMVIASVTDEQDADDRTDDEIEALYKYETGDGLTVQGADDNQIRIDHDAENTTTAGKFRYWIHDVTTADQPITLLKGTFDVEPAATDV